MGNSQQKASNKLLDAQSQQIDKDYAGPLATVNSRSNTAYGSSQAQIPGLRNRFDDWSRTGGFGAGDWDQFDSAFNSDTGGGGGGGSIGDFDESRFSSALSGYDEFTRGGGVDADSIRARSNRAIPQFYQNLKDESSRRRMVNPYGPSFDAEQAKMARMSGQQTQENIRDTELGISDLVSKNKQFGISGLANLNSTIAGLKSNQDIARAGLDESAAGRRDAAAGRRQSGALQKQGMIQSGKLSGLSGLSGLFDTENQNAKDYLNTQFGGIADKNNAKLGSIMARNSGNNNPWWQKLLGAGASVAGAYYGNRASS